jgi:glycosyltransferase involved in cell wall biosynthesis
VLVGFDIRPLIFTRAGIKTYLYNLIVNLAKENRCRLHLFSSSRSFIPWQEISENITEEIIRLPHLHSLCERFWQEFLLPRAVARRKIEVFHGPRFSLPKRLSCPGVVTIHDVAFKKLPQFVSRQTLRYFDTAVSFSRAKAARIIVPSETAKYDLIEQYGVKEDKISSIYEASDAAFCQLADLAKFQQIKEKFEIRNKFILFTGTIEPRKNVARLLGAYELLKEKENVDLVIAGSFGWLYADVLRTIKRLRLQERVIFTGYVTLEELVYLYNACEAFIFPSLDEGFGLPVLEAMQCGAAVVASDIAVFKEIFAGSCHFVDPKSIESIADGIQQVLDNQDLRSQLRKRALEKAKNFSWEKTASQTRAVYESVI